MKPAAFQAAFSDLKLVKTRQVAQLIFEIPLADFDAAYEVLGGMPNPASERWFALAAINPSQAEKESNRTPSPTTAPQPEIQPRPAGVVKEKRDWRDLQPAQQAGIRCGEPLFQAFLKEQYNYTIQNSNDIATAVRAICGVNSRVELGTNHKARVLWHQLDSEFETWKLAEQVGA